MPDEKKEPLSLKTLEARVAELEERAAKEKGFATVEECLVMVDALRDELNELKTVVKSTILGRVQSPPEEVEESDRLDKSKPFTTHRSLTGVVFEQGGRMFDGKGLPKEG